MKTESEIILDSLIEDQRITCFRITFPRIVNAELLRHRAFSFCSASSRAIPIERIIEQYVNYEPERWSKHQPGMQPKAPEFEGKFFDEASQDWKDAKNYAIEVARSLADLGASKEQVNRILEPYSYITLILQGSEKGFKNFFELRCDPTAQYEIRELALLMKEQYDNNKPKKRMLHVPFIKNLDEDITTDEMHSTEKAMIMVSVARSARTSYFNFDGKPSGYDKDKELYKKLIKAFPPHLSPSEFPVMSRATALEMFGDISFDEFFTIVPNEFNFPVKIKKDMSGNLNAGTEVVQFRKLLEINLNII